MSESIKTFWRMAYMKLFDEAGKVSYDSVVYLDEGEYKRLLWRFYWRIGGAYEL